MLQELDASIVGLLGDEAKVLTPDAQKESIAQMKGLSKKDKDKKSNQFGLVDRNLIRNKILKTSHDDSETRIDDFGGTF